MPTCDLTTSIPSTSRELCRAALDIYRALFARLRWTEPDASYGKEYISGMHWLEARAGATEWIVPLSTLVEAQLLLESAQTAPDAEIVEWVCVFPGRFLSVIDRRHDDHGPGRGRRAIDHVPISAVRAMPRP